MAPTSLSKLLFYLTAMVLLHRHQQVAGAPQESSSSTHQVSSSSSLGVNSWIPSLPIGHTVPLNGTLASAILALQPRQSSSSFSRMFRPNNSESSSQQDSPTSTTSPPSTLSTATTSGITRSSTSTTSAPVNEQRSRFQADMEGSGSNINEMVALSSLQNVRNKLAVAPPHPGHGIVDMANTNNNESGGHEEPEATEEEESLVEEEPQQQQQKFGRQSKTSPIHHSNHLPHSPAIRSPVMSPMMRYRPNSERRHQEAHIQQHRGEPRSHSANPEQQKYEQDEAAGRREQEAAEASEADLINKSALDEQRQQQREIIAAQAASDARAIKEQQELLLKQQLLQQQMISRRHQEIEAERSVVGRRGKDGGRAPQQHQYREGGAEKMHQQQRTSNNEDEDEQQELPQAPAVKGGERPRASPRVYQAPQERRYQPHPGLHLQEEASRQLETAQTSDNQFSDQLDMSQSASLKDEVYDFTMQRKPVAASTTTSTSASASSPASVAAKQVAPQQAADLQGEAQRSFETTAQDTLTGQHKDYFQFAESYKKGQFHSGYKRGGNNLQVSGHASQHVNQAEGHNKWNAPKGRGSSYWELKHGKKQRSQKAQPEEANKEQY